MARKKSAPTVVERRRPTRVTLPSDSIRTVLTEAAAEVRVLQAQVDALREPPDALRKHTHK
jgi:hypothetical protein